MTQAKHRITSSEKGFILQTVSVQLLETRDEIVAAYCFGSFLKDDFTDMDLGLLLNSAPEEPLAYEMDLEIELEKFVPYCVDVRVLNQAPISFCQSVFKGKLIVDRDPARRAEFEGRVLKEYFDFAPFRQRYLAEVLNALV
jgi:uncharacterized protein